MNSREKILSTVLAHQPSLSPLPVTDIPSDTKHDVLEKFKTMLVSIGGAIVETDNIDAIKEFVNRNFTTARRVISLVPGMFTAPLPADPHALEDVDVAILPGQFGVAENGAIWITDSAMGDRALPFICQHLVLVINRNDIVHNLHEAYQTIGSTHYDYGTFIAGPSKTADIEQSLVLGAHGPKGLVVVLVNRP
ncbi:MAG: LutC/YkgG family protein [Bacteroidota bacterium]